MTQKLDVLIVEDNPIDEKLIAQMLSLGEMPSIQVSSCKTLNLALSRLSECRFDLVLLDLSLPDSYGIDTFINLKHHFPDIPVIILTSMENESASIKAIQHGAQDYLIKKEISSVLLLRSIRYALERFQLVQELKQLSLKDELTGLLNRRGFSLLGDQLLKTAQRAKRNVFVMFTDLDGLKLINDNYGHDEGDRALLLMTEGLEETFRDSDLISRWGGDEFVVMGFLEEEEETNTLSTRLNTHIDKLNKNSGIPFKISFSEGFSVNRTVHAVSLDKLLEEADEKMYQEKQKKKR
jgi:diguanylate cyclase (GGDEF)-like protein